MGFIRDLAREGKELKIVESPSTPGPLPENFQFSISCKSCPGGLSADGHYTMEGLDVWLAAHMAEFKHMDYMLSLQTG